jgi:hypothetical protein
MTEAGGRRAVAGRRKDSLVADRKLTGTHTTAGFAASRAGVGPPEFERSSVPHPDELRTTSQVEADRLRLIQQRLQNDFYEVSPASERIAAAVMTDLKDLEEGASALPH